MSNNEEQVTPQPGAESQVAATKDSGDAAQAKAAPAKARPAPAKAQPVDGPWAGEGITRRDLLRRGAFSTIALFFAQLGVGALAMFWPSKVSGFGGKVNAGKVTDFPVGGAPVKVRDGKFYVSRLPEGMIALYWKCPHLGCTVPWAPDEDHFHCPCHGSIYERTGQNIAGPAPRPMDYMEMTIAPNGDVIVDTGKIHQRERYDPSQLTKV